MWLYDNSVGRTTTFIPSERHFTNYMDELNLPDPDAAFPLSDSEKIYSTE